MAPSPGRLVDLEAVHQPPGAHHAQAHAGGRAVAPVEDRVEVADAGPRSLDADHQELRRVAALDRELDLAAARVLERVAGDLGDRGGDARLVLALEAEARRDLARPLARRHDVLLVADPKSEMSGRLMRRRSRRAPRPSRRRDRAVQSRYSTPARARGGAGAGPDSGPGRQRLPSPSECMTSTASVGQG